MDVSTDLVRLLFEVGTMAAWRGDTVDARTILEGVRTARPESALPGIGLAVSYMNEGRFSIAAEVLEEALDLDTECDIARTHLALALKLSGFNDRCHSLCNQVVVNDRDATAVELASMLLSIPSDASPNAQSTSASI